MAITRAIFRSLVGLVFGFISAIILSPAFAAFSDAGSPASAAFGIVCLIGIIFGLFAPTIRRALGRGFLLAGVCMLALPISSLLLSGRAISDVTSAAAVEDQAFTAIGAGLAGAAITGAATFFGMIFGGIFVIIGIVLVLGGRREVTIIQKAP